MKVLFFGDLAGTGFGTVTLDLGEAMLDVGLDVRFVSQAMMGDLPARFEERTYKVNNHEGWTQLQGAGMIGLFDGTLWDDRWTPDAAIILGDFAAVREVVLANDESRASFSAVPTFHYCPLEGVDSPPSWAALWSVLHPIAVSESGADEIHRLTGVRPPVIYHGIDQEQFRPVSSSSPLSLKTVEGRPPRMVRSRAECKAAFAYNGTESWSSVVRRMETRKWIFRADRNMPRKMYASMLRSVAPVLASHPDTWLVIHCRSADEGGNLQDLFSKYPPVIRNRIIMTGFHDLLQGASRNILTALYNAADVYVSTSAEGFGLTVAEAIACGTPAVGLDYSAVPEVIGPAGLTVPVGAYIDNQYDYLWARPDERKFTEAVASLLDDDVLRKRLGKAGPGHVRTNFSWPKAALAFEAAISERLAVAA